MQKTGNNCATSIWLCWQLGMIECLKLNYYTENFVLWYLCSKNWPQIHVLFLNWSFKMYLTLMVYLKGQVDLYTQNGKETENCPLDTRWLAKFITFGKTTPTNKKIGVFFFKTFPFKGSKLNCTGFWDQLDVMTPLTKVYPALGKGQLL